MHKGTPMIIIIYNQTYSDFIMDYYHDIYESTSIAWLFGETTNFAFRSYQKVSPSL